MIRQFLTYFNLINLNHYSPIHFLLINIKRGNMRKIISLFLGIALFIGFTVSANAAKTLKCQTVISAKADEVKMLKDWGNDITALTGGEIKFEILPAGTVVGVKETLDAVDKGLIDCGFAWTHYWSGEHPAAMLFGSPVAGAGV